MVRPDIDAFRAAALRCPLPPAIELIGEKWAFLILRGAFNGLQHFEQFQAGLGIARNILSNRLGQAGRGRHPRAHARPADRRKVIYSLTAKGEALLPVRARAAPMGRGLGPWPPGHLPRRPARRPAGPARSASWPQDGRELEAGRHDVGRPRDRRAAEARRPAEKRAARRPPFSIRCLELPTHYS